MKRNFTSSSTLWSCFIALAMMMASQSAWAEYVKLTALSGTGGTGGEGYPSLVDAKEGTKMGHSFDPSNPERAEAWIVVKAAKAVVPEFYFLVTGGDTGSYPTRNWKKWNIYGGNFESDADAVRGSIDNPAAGGWTLIDERDGDPLPQANTASANFQFNEADGTTAYQYFWIEILESVAGTDIWLQMGEWGLGTYGDFQKYLEDLANVQTGTDEPVVYNIISGDRNNADGEGLAKLFDGDISTKWGNGFSPKNYGATSGGAYFIVKTSRAMAPTYYKLVTGNDNASWNNRNWQDWQIYGIAAADVVNGKPDRASDKWVLLDRKDNITKEQLPDKNMFTVIFSLSEENTTEYQYFKVEIDKTQGAGYMQMGEFALGDEYTLVLDRNAIIDGITFDPDAFAEKALLDQMAATIASLKECTDPFKLGSLNTAADDLKSKIATSESNYAELITIRNQAINLINEENLTDEAMAYAQAWVSETDAIAPSNDYPVGNFAYIKANRQLTGEEAKAEAGRFNDYLMVNVKNVDPAIYATYTTIVDANGFNDGEKGHSLIDGDRENTKWCASTDHKPWRLIFKSDEPIKPTYYGLVTGGDTYSYPDRNWKTWKIWAANFDSDEEAMNEESDKWVLIDAKSNVGTDVLKTTNKYESYINLSVGCTEPYQYFKIVVEASGGNLIQMNEFTFYNQGNLAEYRNDFLAEFADYDPEAEPAYIGYVNQYKEKYQTLQNATNPSAVMKAYNDLKELMNDITASAEKYANYLAVYDELQGTNLDSESLSTWFEGYSTENEGAGVKYVRGTYEYIMETLSLDNDAIDAETAYLQSIINAANEGLYILLGGHTVGQWGDGYYGHLIDGIAKNTEGTDEEGKPITILATKWGGMADVNGDTYIIFRTSDAVNPFFYTLTTGNDTGTYQDRNWGTWYIYGANFEGDGAATKDAEGWVLIDAKENIGKDRLHPVDAEESYFGFSTETTVPYTYYKIVVTKAFAGDAIQMNEIHFGTETEFEEIKDQYIAKANEFDYDVVAEQTLLDQYGAAITDIDECLNMEALFRANYVIETLQEQITKSAAAYTYYQDQVDAAKTYLQENNLADSEAKTIFVNYLNEDEEASELYPNGTAKNIIDEHVLADSVVLAETEFLESLKVAAVAAGYGKGMDISSLIANRNLSEVSEEAVKDEEGNTLGKIATGWSGYVYRSATREDMKMSAAEFCIENAKFNISQTLTGMKNGFYQVKLNAGFRANGDLLSYNYAAMAYANNVATFVPVVREDAVEDSLESYQGNYADKKIYSKDSTEVYGWGIWGCEGAAQAFLNGRYEVTLVAQVTDGNLTIGLKNEGTTKGGDWTGAGNFRLFYLGEDIADAAEALKEVAEYNAARINTLTELYTAPVYEAEDYSEAPGFGAAQKATLAENSGVATFEAETTISETMQSIYLTKNAYLDLFHASDKVYAKWFEHVGVNRDTADKAEAAVYDVKDNLETGAYNDAVAVLEAKEAFYAAYPDYLQVKNDKGTNVDFTEDTFAFDIVTTGANPSLELTGLYEPLEEDEVILAFDYTAEQAIEGGYFYYETPNLLTVIKEAIPTLPATETWTTVYYNVSKGVKNLNFGSAIDHSIYWSISSKATKDNSLALGARNFRFMTKAQMKAEGGKALNGTEGDLNGDDKVDIADAVTVLNFMADGSNDPDADLNEDGKVDIADFVTVLNLMAEN